MSQAFNVAVLGATGLVGQTMIELLEERHFPVGELFPLASERSAGTTVTFKGEEIEVLNAEDFDWSLVQLAFFSAGGEISAKFAPLAAEAGCVVIDNTSTFRYEPDVPLVIPEVNGFALADFRNRNIIANPNCSTIQMLLALKPIHEAAGIERINVSTYQSVSGAGKSAMEELALQTANLLNTRPVTNEAFSRQIAFNCIPQIDEFTDNDYTKEEMKMVWETQKILCDSDVMVNATAVRVPVFYGHGESIHLETRMPIDAEQTRQLLSSAPGIKVYEAREDFPTQVSSASGNDWVHVGRIRDDISHPSGLNLWVVSDNVRKGAATNSIQIAEVLVKDFL
ncbi:aspartate-semialdehyde dehydrogenase [Aestuariibacter sp. A3R04]|uniref:aspartate-semialdehyde dehydrogenase n=1 Tax=Aestuariibacter sp. A3R04 TaxID=2841571 RepID=UPI001C07FBA5|nr:aspartate-semialdehyde dehydrogenase [Aestuariibacter sp. A3R04]MBU3023305.1 aspartate-semialdehyde dehydrogenase [Aestuariibacter sp. A3R04]